MSDIKVHKVNESTIFIETTNLKISKEISNYFTVKAPNYRFSPKYRQGFWDGNIRFFSTMDATLAIGLTEELKNFARGGDYSIKLNFEDGFSMEPEEFRKFVDMLNIVVPGGGKPRNYQIAAAWDAITKRRISLEIPTSGGKTLVSYIVARFMQLTGRKMLMVVPTTSLVEQTFSDWYTYGWYDIDKHVHRIYGGQKKVYDAPIIVSTWQSLYKDKELFSVFDTLLVDEAHNCFHPSTLITMADHSKKRIDEINIGDIVLSYNEEDKKFEAKTVDFVFTNLSDNSDMYELELDDNTFIKVTGNHKVLTEENGWVEVKNLLGTENLIAFA